MSTKKKNCWEFMGCGREPRGSRSDEQGACPAATEERLNGKNDGTNGGRACWVVADTLGQESAKDGDCAHKLKHCRQCPFYQCVHREKGDNAVRTLELFECIMDMNKDIR